MLIQAMKNHKLFVGMNGDQVEKILTCAKPRVESYAAKNIIIGQGEEATHILVILAGEISLLKEDYNGNCSLVGSLLKDDVYGQMAVFGDSHQNKLIVQAATACEILYLNKNLFYQTCSNTCVAHQMLIKNMMTLLANQAGVLERKISYLTAKTLRCKVARFLLEEYQNNNRLTTFSLKLNREKMADYFDVQRPSLSRELIKLKNEGVIDYYKATFKLLDLAKLIEYAQ